MKQITLIILGTLLSCLFATESWSQGTATDNFERIKKLEGQWKGVKPDGKKVVVTYEIMSGGSAIVETLMPAAEPNMVTVYHLDGDKLMMTHYCSAGNQPRMVASNAEDGSLNFNFVGATNLKDKSEGHMQGLEVVFLDENHFNQVWIWSKENEEIPSTFEYERIM